MFYCDWYGFCFMWLNESRSGGTVPAVLQAQVADIADGYRSTLILNLITLTVCLFILHIQNEAGWTNFVWYAAAVVVVACRAYALNALNRRGKLLSAPQSSLTILSLGALASALGRVPILTHSTTVLSNWRRLDPAGPVALPNLDVAVRILGGVDERWFFLATLGVELAGELLHFTFPDRYWLWARWMYNAATHTGTLPLLMDGDKELRGATSGETYLKVGRAIVMVTQVKDAEWLFHGGLTDAPLERPFAIDVFLAASYGAYLYGITAWRLTREFHKVLPPLPRLVRRFLGLQVAKRIA